MFHSACRQQGYGDRLKPGWTPPGWAFAIIWSTISGLRATAGTLIWQACGDRLFVFPLIAFIAHLSIGDTWNYVNNIECRFGLSFVLSIVGVWASVVSVTAIYFSVSEVAGWVILPSAVWLTVAMKLIGDIWVLNGKVRARQRAT